MLVFEQVFSFDQIDDVAQKLYDMRRNVSVYVFKGTLGAGKTTLIQALLKKWGINQSVTSPTFGYVNMYRNDQNELLYHFDLYRIMDLDQFIGAGFDEFLYAPHSWVFIEWPEIVEPLLTKRVCSVSLVYEDLSARRMIVDYSK